STACAACAWTANACTSYRTAPASVVAASSRSCTNGALSSRRAAGPMRSRSTAFSEPVGRDELADAGTGGGRLGCRPARTDLGVIVLMCGASELAATFHPRVGETTAGRLTPGG